MQKINFAHNYNKLQQQHYTTIRGKSKVAKYKVGEVIEVTVNRQHLHYAVVREMCICRIGDLSLDLLRRDAAYNGQTITTKQDFVDLLNSFYPRSRFKNRRAKLETEVCIIWLEVIE